MPVGAPRKVHQDDYAIVADKPRIGTDRRVARHAQPFRLEIAGAVEELAQRLESRDLRGRFAVAGDFGGAGGRSQRRAMAQRDIDTVLRECAGCALRPFDQRDRALGQWRQADLFQFRRIVDAVEIRVKQRKWRQIVGLREREGRAWHLDGVIVGEISDHRPGGGGFAGAKVAGKGNDIARADQQRKIGHQMRGRCLVR